ncbi:uncharacterized protein DFL_002904 [Arthrobotrys flagrans]|uniref:tyrosinase n=1 Tax=Arthrobotrys flagrans TaxID=97331 RepID=A0A437ABU9_ARTFL|nr:hypothetical protein DFL_002904 [Arthrobotrys flagrans]
MDVKTFTEMPKIRSRVYGRRWLPALLASICMIVTLFALGKLMVAHNVIRNESLLNFVDPLRMTTTPNIFDAGTTVSGTDNGKSHKMSKRQTSRYISSGITWNGIQQRRNWNDFAADADLLNLFLCGLEAMQATDQNTLQSYFQIAGIHGAPYRAWNGVEGTNPNTGYCPHASILFPTWHRPYLATIEQILGNHMRTLANRYPAGSLRTRYQRAANRFRLPYWDWASDAQVPPIIGSQATVRVRKPQGFVTIPNPMISYVFHPFRSSFFPFPPFNTWRRTLRQPDRNGNSRPAVVNQQLRANQISLRNRVFNLLNYQRQFNIFSNKAWNDGNDGNQDSIESIHDLIHGLVGGEGHMAVVDTSAMDPIFWLHHCNVDRIVAMWQVLNPTAWTPSQVTIFGTRTNPAGSVEDSTTGLTPFYRYPNTMWTSNTARDTKRFYYTYPETDGLSANALRARIRQLYGGTAPQNQVRGTTTGGATTGGGTTTSGRTTTSGGTTTASRRSYSGTGHSLATNGKYHEWAANVRLNKHETGGTYLINIFIENPSNGVEWTGDPNFVGSYYLLSKNGTCDGCSENSLVTGSVPLTHMLITCARGGKLKDLSPESVIPYLKNNLQWRVQLPGNTGYINPSDVKSLKISVIAATVTLPSSSDQDAPITKWTTYYDITNQKPGGLCYGDLN